MGRACDLLDSLRARGVKLWFCDDQIRYRAMKGIINRADIELLQEHGTEILEILKQTSAVDTQLPESDHKALEETLPLSFQQEWVWSWLTRNTSNCAITLALRLCGGLNPEWLKSSLTSLTENHDSLRTTLVEVDGQRRQKVVKSTAFDWDVIEVPAGGAADARENASLLIRALFARRMNWVAGPLFTAKLYRVSPGEHVLAIAIHHMIADAMSINRMLRELLKGYRDLAVGKQGLLAKDAQQYGDYVCWQRRTYFERLDENERFWDRKLRDVPTAKWPVDGYSDEWPRQGNALLDIELGLEVSAELHNLAAQKGTTVALVALALYASLVFCWSDQSDIVVPFIVASRILPSHASIVGLLAHPLFIRIEIEKAQTFAELLEHISEEFRAAYWHLDFGKMAATRSDLLGCPTVQWLSEQIDHTGGLESSSASVEGDELTIEPFSVETDWLDSVKVEAPLGVEFWNTAEGIRVQVFYRADLFQATAMERFSVILRSIARAVARDGDTSIPSLREKLSSPALIE